MKKIILLMSLLVIQQAIADDLNNLNFNEFNSDIEKLEGKKKDIRFPDLVEADMGELEKDTTQMKINSVKYEYNKKPPPIIKKFIDNQTSKIKGKKLELRQFVKFLKTLEQDIVKMGYPMVRVVFTQQTINLEKASPKIYIISGIVEEINIQNKLEIKDKDIQSIIHKVLADIKNKEYLDSETINQKMIILKGFYGLSSKIFLSRGEKIGGYIVNVNVLYKNKSRAIFVKNDLNNVYGNYSIKGIATNNFIINDTAQQISVMPAVSIKQGDNTYYRSLTFNYNRYALNGSYVEYVYTLSRTASITKNKYKLYSSRNNFSVMYNYPYVLKHSERLYLSGGLVRESSTTKNKNTDSYQYEDISTELQLKSNGIVQNNNRTHESMVIFGKNTDMWSAKYNEITRIPSSRSGARSNSSRLFGNYKFTNRFQNRAVFKFATNFQTTFGVSVISGQQFSGNGFEKVQGLVGSGLKGDEGYSLYAEYEFPTIQLKKEYGIILKDSGDVLIRPFVSSGFSDIDRNQPTAVENKNAKAKSFSVGFNSTIYKGLLFKIALNHSKKQDFENLIDKSFGISILSKF